MRSAFLTRLRRSTGFLALSLALTACSTDGLSPSARIDETTNVGAIPPAGTTAAAPVPETDVAAYPVAVEPVANVAGTTAALSAPEGGVDVDAMLGVGGVTGLAEEQSREIGSLPPGPQPVPSDAETGNALPAARSVRDAESVLAERRRLTKDEVAFLPRAANPARLDDAPTGDGMPSTEAACRAELTRLGVRFAEVPPISQGKSCGIPYPLKLSGLSGNITVKPAVTLNCQVTLAFARWVKNELNPAARARYLSGIAAIEPMGGYSCRTINSRRGNPMSEHARGNAIDIGTFVLKSGKEIDVRQKGFFAFREKGLLKAVRGDSCKYFTTVLGPGSDPQHWNHFHFDLRSHKSGRRHCD
ncbi:extensin family protein [Ensifer soli]|uniref:extensin family protein n=1 Tax=Ciceribacter sp. sgz301302 TaxID=3342379 RepID=UPI0035BA5C6B